MSNELPPVRRQPVATALLRFLVIAAVLAVSLVVAPVSAASADSMSGIESDLAAEFFAQLNAERGARGLTPLVHDAAITPDATAWANELARDQALAHSNDPRAEIVAYGQRTGQVTDAWMRSAGHRSLVVDGNLGYAGVGVVCDGNGQIWAVVQFRRINTRLGTQSSSAKSPVVTSDATGSSCDDLPTGTVNSIKRLYSAYFLRAADKDGLAYWQGEVAAGAKLSTISVAFAASSEFRAEYGRLSNRKFVQLVYQNVMGRNPDTDGYDYWVGRLGAGMTRGMLMTNFSESAEYRIRTGLS